jgi:hypothetical protein
MPQLVIDTTAQQAQRLTRACGRQWGLVDENRAPRDATAAEIKIYVIRVLRDIVRKQEERDAAEVIKQNETPFEPT